MKLKLREVSFLKVTGLINHCQCNPLTNPPRQVRISTPQAMPINLSSRHFKSVVYKLFLTTGRNFPSDKMLLNHKNRYLLRPGKITSSRISLSLHSKSNTLCLTHTVQLHLIVHLHLSSTLASLKGGRAKLDSLSRVMTYHCTILKLQFLWLKGEQEKRNRGWIVGSIQ